MNTDPARRLVSIGAALDAGRLPPPEDRAWLAAGVKRWIMGDVPLDAALDLSGGQGLRSARTRLRTEARDELLRQAHSMMDGQPWHRSIELAREILDFQSMLWPKWKDRPEPPHDCSRLRGLLFAAQQFGQLPRSERRIHDICAAMNRD